MSVSLHNVLVDEGYRLVEDAWERNLRRTYIHDEDATRQAFRDLERRLGPAGWHKHPTNLRTLCRCGSDELIEVEPGGSETSGHFLHYMKVSSEP